MQHCWCALFPLKLNTESTLWSAQSKIVCFLHLVLVSSSILSNVSNERFIMQRLTDVIFCSKHHVLISNTATKKVPEDKEFGYYSAVVHQRVEGEFPGAAAVSVWWGEEQVRKHIPSALSLLPFMPSLHGAVAVPQPSLNTRVCREKRWVQGICMRCLGYKSLQTLQVEFWDHTKLLGYPWGIFCQGIWR